MRAVRGRRRARWPCRRRDGGVRATPGPLPFDDAAPPAGRGGLAGAPVPFEPSGRVAVPGVPRLRTRRPVAGPPVVGAGARGAVRGPADPDRPVALADLDLAEPARRRASRSTRGARSSASRSIFGVGGEPIGPGGVRGSRRRSVDRAGRRADRGGRRSLGQTSSRAGGSSRRPAGIDGDTGPAARIEQVAEAVGESRPLRRGRCRRLDLAGTRRGSGSDGDALRRGRRAASGRGCRAGSRITVFRRRAVSGMVRVRPLAGFRDDDVDHARAPAARAAVIRIARGGGRPPRRPSATGSRHSPPG